MHTWMLGSSRWGSASSMFVNNAIDTFYVLRRKNISGIETYFNINNNLIKVIYNCIDTVNGPMWSSWAKSLYTVNQ